MIRPGGTQQIYIFHPLSYLCIQPHQLSSGHQSSNAVMSFIVCKLCVSSSSSSSVCPPRLSPHSVSRLLWLICFLSGRIPPQAVFGNCGIVWCLGCLVCGHRGGMVSLVCSTFISVTREFWPFLYRVLISFVPLFILKSIWRPTYLSCHQILTQRLTVKKIF